MARLPQFPLATLTAFRAAARRMNLRAAADDLSLTHSAVSQQIRHLESQLGFALFERRGRRLVLNEAGVALQRATEAALTRLEAGVSEARARALGQEEVLRLTVLPSFAQRWLLPRMARWRERHPALRLEIHSSQAVVDLAGEGFHAALRVGSGVWPGLHAEPMLQSPLIAVAAPERARRVLASGVGGRRDAAGVTSAIAAEPLLGDTGQWEAWFAAAGCTCTARPVASFNDAALMLQAAEQDLGVALARELLAADALAEGRLQRLSPLALAAADEVPPMWWVARPALRDWPPLVALRAWLFDEVERSRQALAALPAVAPFGEGWPAAAGPRR
jgi:LysR family glycine cleavage system transcriptional activator